MKSPSADKPHPARGYSFESQLRIFVWLLCLLSSIATLLSYFVMDYQRHAARDEKGLQALIAALKAHIAEPLARGDYRQVERHVRAALESPLVDAIGVTDARRREIVRVLPAASDAHPPSMEPVLAGIENPGWLTVHPARDANFHEFAKDFTVAILLASALAILGWWLLRPTMQHAMKPVYKLADAMDTVARSGRLDVELPNVDLDCVLGHVARSFSRMMVELRQRDETIKAHQADLEAEVSARTESLHEALNAKDRFLAHMTHELRSPLSSVLGFAEIIESGVQGPVSAEQTQSLKHIRDAGEHLLGVINDILDLAKAQAGEHTVQLEALDIEGVVQDAIRLVEPQAAKRSQTVSFRCAGDVPTIAGDRRRIQQILINLLTNAVKFTRKGRALGVDIDLKDRGGSICIGVWDEGQGIRNADKKMLFKPFFQAASNTMRVPGTGIGLALSQSFARLHGGDITVKSRVGFGSRFEVTLPVRRPDAPAVEAGTPATAQAA